MRNQFRTRIILLAAIAALVLAAGCSRSTTTAPPSTTVKTSAATTATTGPATTTAATTRPPASTAASTPAATSGARQSGDLKVALSSLYDERFDPVPASPSNQFTIASPYLESLQQMDGPKIVPMIAESWQLSPDGASWIYKIRKGVKFSNGDDLTAADVKFGLDRYLAAEAYNKDFANWVKSVEQVDDYNVRIVTKGPQPFLPYTTGYSQPFDGQVMPKAYYQKVGGDGYNKAPIGSGPWKFSSYAAGDSVRYEAVSQHWRIVPEYKTMTLLKAPEESTRVAMLKTGQADIAEITLDSVKELEAAGMKTHSLTTGTALVAFYGALDPRAAGKPISDIRVRKALSLAINRDEMNKTFFFGKATPPMPPYAWEGTADIDVKATQDYGAKVFAYDPTQARQLLAQAGYPNGFQINLHAYTMGDAPYLPKMAQIIQGYWLKIGVNANILPTEWSVFRVQARPGSSGAPTDQLVSNAATHSASNKFILTQGLPGAFLKGGSLQLTYPGVAELEQIVPLASVELDPAKRADLNKRIMTLASESYLFLPVGGVPYMAATSPAVDIQFNQPSAGIVPYAERAKRAAK